MNPCAQIMPVLTEHRPILRALSQARQRRVEETLTQLRNRMGSGASTADLPCPPLPRQLAITLNELLPSHELHARLSRLGFSPKWCDGQLEVVDLTSGTIAVRRGTAGKALIGRGIRPKIVEAFPELYPLTLTNSSSYFAPGTGAAAIAQPPRTDGGAEIHVDLSQVQLVWTIESVTALYLLGGDSTTPITNAVLADGYGSVDGLGSSQGIDWGKGGVDWVTEHASESFTTNGTFSFSFSVGDPTKDWTITGYFEGLEITYTGSGGDVCRLVKTGANNEANCPPCAASTCSTCPCPSAGSTSGPVLQGGPGPGGGAIWGGSPNFPLLPSSGR